MNQELDDEIGVISESDARLILEVLQNIDPGQGYKAKHKKSIKAILKTIWRIDWEKDVQECDDFLAEWRDSQNKKVA